MTLDRSRRRASHAAADPGFAALKAQVIARTGHHYYADKDDLLFDRLVKRFRALGLPDCHAYARHLDGEGGESEWSALEAEITIGETFFFRYAEQFSALKDTILPGVIAARAETRRLRVWSAGCSTGAEPYSVAILLHELLGAKLADWDVSITGTDISAAALATARTGEYGRWALRTMEQENRARWFRAIPPRPGPMREGGYRLRPEFQRMVRFERQNLIGLIDGGVPESFAGFDLILCRNVLIYFSAEAVMGIVRGFGDRLMPGGWLLIGHAEPNPAFAGWLTPVNLPGTVAYRRPDAARPVEPAPSAAAAAVVPPAILPERTAPPVVSPSVLPVVPPFVPAAFDARRLPESAPPPGPEPSEPDAPPHVRIRALADAGETAQAWRILREALDADPTDATLRYYEGLLAISLGREAEAERALRGALFLRRDFVMAHYHLGLFLTARARDADARRSLDNALRLAQALPAETELPEGDGVTAGDLIENLRLALGRDA